MKELVILVEERSAKELLDGLLPRLIPDDWKFRCIPFEGKQDLEKGMGRKLRAWRNSEARFVVLRDQDSGDCQTVKQNLMKLCCDAGKKDVLVRIACRNLESWIVGDLPVFAQVFSAPSADKAKNKAKFRNPDDLGNAVAELRKFVPTYQKLDGARRMGEHLYPTNNKSHSFKVFCSGIQKMTVRKETS